MQFDLMPLPYEQDALAPFLSARTVAIHHTKHHSGYVKKLDDALARNRLREAELDAIVAHSDGHVFNLAAQVWNHDFYWQSLSPTKVELADGELVRLLKASFGSVAEFRKRFAETAADEFGSGWAWLAFNPADNALEVFSTTDAINPLTSGRVPILTLDVWEHAYYLDYQNERGRYIDEFLDEHINWTFAETNLRTAPLESFIPEKTRRSTEP